MHQDTTAINISMYAMNGNAVIMTTCWELKALSYVHTERSAAQRRMTEETMGHCPMWTWSNLQMMWEITSNE